MRRAGLAALAVLVTSLAGRALAPDVGLYLEPWEVVHRLHLWQLLTWIPAGASLSFVAHAGLLGFAIAKGVPLRLWLGATFGSGVAVTLLAHAVPALYSCTFTGAGVGAAAAASAWAAGHKGARRAAATLLALAPAGLDAAVDGPYSLTPFAFALAVAWVWVRRRRRSHPGA